MTTTRQHLNNAALSVAKLLGMITGMADAEIDEIIDNAEAFRLAEVASDLCEYTINWKAHKEGRSRPLQEFIEDLKDARDNP